MKILDIPHCIADYLCTVNGLDDVYEWKRGSRIPDGLLHYCQLGFIDVVNKKADPPRMVFLGAVIGKKQYLFWQDIMGYRLHHSDGMAFRITLERVKALVDRGIPVILFGLDMYHLTYHEKFYHNVHIPGHIVLMAGYDDHHVYVHDNSKEGVRALKNEDLMVAWQDGYPGLARKNAYFGIEFADAPADERTVIRTGLNNMARRFLEPPVGFMGIKGLSRLVKTLPSWAENYSAETLKAIYTHIVTFTGSVLPMLPAELEPANESFDNPHNGCRDRMAQTLRKYAGIYGDDMWFAAADHFEKSGEVIAQITSAMAGDILHGDFSDPGKYAQLFRTMLEAEQNAFKCFV